VTEWLRGRDARLAGKDLAPIFGGHPREIEHVGFKAVFCRDDIACDAHHAKCFRHLARTGVFAACRTVDDQDARGSLRVFLPPFGGCDGLACFQPLDREIIVRIGKTVTGFHGVRRFTVVVVAVPRRVGDFVEFFLKRLKGGIEELRQETFLEFGLVELNTRHAFADFDLNHGVPSRLGPWLTLMAAMAFLTWPWLALKPFQF